MPSPFLGMNPYLENPEIWPALHNRLIVAIADFLVPKVLPKYFVDIEQRVDQTTDTGEDIVLVGLPDVTVQQEQVTKTTDSNIAVAPPVTKPEKVIIPMPQEIRQTYLEIRAATSKRVITTIEILSPVNKRSGVGREKYELKRERIFSSRTHLVEIDLLRSGEPMLVFDRQIKSDYRILVSREENRPTADMYGFNLQDKIPLFPLPLQKDDVEPTIDLNELLNQVYDRARYDVRIDYTQKPVRELSETNQVWADNLLRSQGLRN